MRAGQLRHRVRIEYEVKSADGAGGNTKTWAVLDVLPAKVTPEMGAESERSQKTAAATRYKVTLRHRPGITAAMRLIFGTQIMHILSVVTVSERKEEMEIIAEAIAGEVTT